MKRYKTSFSNIIKKSIGIGLAAILIITLFFSIIFIAEESGHKDCQGEDCPICSTIEICISNINLIGNTVVTAVILSIGVIICKMLIVSFIRRVPFDTLVGDKVRIND